jgi:hypothetical protein
MPRQLGGDRVIPQEPAGLERNAMTSTSTVSGFCIASMWPAPAISLAAMAGMSREARSSALFADLPSQNY